MVRRSEFLLHKEFRCGRSEVNSYYTKIVIVTKFHVLLAILDRGQRFCDFRLEILA